MGQAELVIAGLLVAVAGLSALARLLSIPYPIVLVIGGALLGFVPGHARGEPRPERRAGGVPAAAALRRGVLREPHRHPLEPAQRSRSAPSGWCWPPWPRSRCVAHAARPRAAVGGGVRARGDRLADRPAGGRARSCAASTCPRRIVSADRGRGAVQRRHRAGRVRGRRGGRRRRQLLAAATPSCASSPARPAGSRSAWRWAGSSPSSVRAPPTPRSASRSRCSAATRPSSRPTRSAPRACWPRSPPASYMGFRGRANHPRAHPAAGV